MSVRRLLSEMDSLELSEWQAVMQIESEDAEIERKRKQGKVAAKNPEDLSAALKAQLATKKG